MTEKQKQEEFLSLLEPVREKLSRYIRAVSRNQEEARDIVGEAILRAWENFGKLKNKDAFSGYIFSIAIRLHKRTGWRKRFFTEYDEEKAENIPLKEISAENRHDVQVLYNAMFDLPEKQREALILFEISGFSLQEIQEIQGGSLSGVKTRLKRGREKLSEILGHDIDLHNKSNSKLNGSGKTLPAKNGAVVSIVDQKVINN